MFLSMTFYLCETAFSVVAMIKSNVQNQYGTEDEGSSVQSDSKT